MMQLPEEKFNVSLVFPYCSKVVIPESNDDEDQHHSHSHHLNPKLPTFQFNGLKESFFFQELDAILLLQRFISSLHFRHGLCFVSIEKAVLHHDQALTVVKSFVNVAALLMQAHLQHVNFTQFIK